MLPLVLGLGCAHSTGGDFEGDVSFRFGRNPEHFPTFRMAMMLLPEHGDPVHDFFDGIALTGGSSKCVGDGNARFDIPGFRSGDYPPGTPEAQMFQELSTHFPESIGVLFPLTFKEFNGAHYKLENVPAGIGFIWIQMKFDGNKAIQIPLRVEFSGKGGTKDLDVDFMKCFIDF